MDPLAAAAERVVARIGDLEAELVGIAESTAAVPDDEHDAEGSTVGYERARVGALLRRATDELAAIDAAAKRASAGGANRCQGCGGPIGEERRAALPATDLCVGCAARHPGARVLDRPGVRHSL